MVRCADNEPEVEEPPVVPGTGPTTMGRMTEAGMGGIPVAEDEFVDDEALFAEPVAAVAGAAVERVCGTAGGGEEGVVDNDSDVDADAAGGACGAEDRLGGTLMGSVLTTGSVFTIGGI